MRKPNIYIIPLVSVLLVMIFHELGHFIAGTSMGYDMKMSLNMVRFPDGATIDDQQQVIFYLAGPLFTLVLVFFAIL